MKRFILFLFLFLMCGIVHASHLDLVPIDGVYSSQHNLSNGSYFSSNQKKYFMDGRIVYCVEPGAGIYTNDYYGVNDLSLSGMSSDILDKISLIGYFGYDYPGHNTDKYFMAAQELIWELIGNNEIHFTTGINSTGDIVNIDFEKNEIMNLVNHYYVKPSFDGELVSGIYGEKVILQDSNNVLSNYEVLSDGAYIEGDRLVIELDKLGSDSIRLSRKKYDKDSSVFYRDDSSQDFMFLRANSFESIIYTESFIPRNRVVVNKIGLALSDYSDHFIYEEKGLTGVHFGLYASSDIYEDNNLVYMRDEMISELVTSDGSLVFDNLPNGDYYLKELSTIDGYILDDTIYDIHLSNSDKEVFEYMVNLNNDRQKIFLNISKNGEVFNGIVSDSGSYSDIPLGGIKFGLYSSNDIYNVYGKKLGSLLLIVVEVLVKS